MSKKGPGKHYRLGMSLMDAVQQFSDEEAVEQMFIKARWPDGVTCPRCRFLKVGVRRTRKPAPFRCKNCKADFSVKTGTVMQGSNLPLSKWALATYLMTTSQKGVSSMKLHRDLGITQKAAWHLAHRIRKAWESDRGLFSGPVEVDETYIGGKERNKHFSKKTKGRGGIGKITVVGVKDRESNQVYAKASPVDRYSLHRFVQRTTETGTVVYTDEAAAYTGIPHRSHEVVKHSAKEYVRDMVHTNGIESFWAMFKRGIAGHIWDLPPRQR